MLRLPQNLGPQIVLEKGMELAVVGCPDLHHLHRRLLDALLQLVRSEDIAFLGIGRLDVVAVGHWHRIGTLGGLRPKLLSKGPRHKVKLSPKP